MSETNVNSPMPDKPEKNFSEPESRETFSQTHNDVNCAVFGNDEYHFKDGQEFGDYIKKLVDEKKTYELRSLLNRYKTSLKQVSEKVWGTDSLDTLQKTVENFIQIGEHLFTGETAFQVFINEVLEKGKLDPAYILSFVKAHRNSLDSAAGAFPGIKKQVDKLYAASDAVVVFDEELFTDFTSFKAFVEDVINRGNTNPGFLWEFVKRHRSTIDSLMKNKETEAVLKPLTKLSESYIVMDSRVFATADDFESYLNRVIEEGRDDPGFLRRFIKEHDKILKTLSKDSRCEKILKALNDANDQIVCLDELVFRSVADFQEYMKPILKNPAYLSRFVRAHESALMALNRVSTLSPVVTKILTAGYSVIELDEYVFGDAAVFARFVGDLKEESRTKPLKGTDFVREHKTGLDALDSPDALVRRLSKATSGDVTLEALKNKHALVTAAREFQAIENSEDNEESIMVNGTRYSPITIKKGDYFKFGNYPQKKNGDTKEPIEWLVLEVNDTEALLVSRYGLDCKEYHGGGKITWKECDLRKWLNDEFMKEAFSEEEQKQIKHSGVLNDDSINNRSWWEILWKHDNMKSSGGNVTWDHVFCLSVTEVKQYFKDIEENRKCWPTDYARSKGLFIDPKNKEGSCYWWLRTGKKNCKASFVDDDGSMWSDEAVKDPNGAVRPALRLFLNM